MEKHKHCINCGISIPPEEIFCSEKCREEYMKKRKKAMRNQQMFLLMMILVIAIYVAVMFFK
jgi:predicted nucleic acid-binding Zn ribbon protein